MDLFNSYLLISYHVLGIVWDMDVDKSAFSLSCEELHTSCCSVPWAVMESCTHSWLRQRSGMYAREVHTNAAWIESGAFAGQVGHLCVLSSQSGNSENSSTNNTAFHHRMFTWARQGRNVWIVGVVGKTDSACNPADSCLQHVC